MYLIVGLGNPGKQYEMTRHNVGFYYVDLLAKKYNQAFLKTKFNGLYTELQVDGEKIILLKPQQYMNLSGAVVRRYMEFFKIDLAHVLIVHDDLDLLLGTYKLKATGSSGGHNGLRDIEKHLGTKDYKRLKIGVSHDRSFDTKDYVLSRFSKDETDIIIKMNESIIAILEKFSLTSFDNLMCNYNQK